MSATVPPPSLIALPETNLLFAFPTFKSTEAPIQMPTTETHAPLPDGASDATRAGGLAGMELLNELKALLSLHRFDGTAGYQGFTSSDAGLTKVYKFTFTPTRTVTWKGDVIAYKIRPLLADEFGCLTIRIAPEDLERMLDVAADDKDLVVIETRRSTHLFSTPAHPVYTLSLAPDTPQDAPLPSPRRSLHNLSAPDTPVEERIEPDRMDNEGWVAGPDGELMLGGEEGREHQREKSIPVLKLNDK